MDRRPPPQLRRGPPYCSSSAPQPDPHLQTPEFYFIIVQNTCAGCPAADRTTEELIQTALTEHLPHIKRAVLVQDISPELLDEARSILKMRHGG